MTLTCCCGATLDIRDDWATPHVEERFYNAHADCLRKTDDDDAFWIRQYAGYAMQGILANNKLLSAFVSAGETIGMEQLAAISKGAVAQATALLDEVKNHEKETEQ